MNQPDESRPTWAEINLNRLASNFQSVKDFVGSKIKYMAVVKADAYGHGAVECAKILSKTGADYFGVALPEEGVILRKNNIKNPIVCLGGFWIGQENLLLEYGLSPVIYSSVMADAFNRAAADKGVIADVHVKIDTGMGRIGIRFDALNEFVENFNNYKNLNLRGVMTHFASADDLTENEFTNLQIKRFNKSVDLIEAKGFRPSIKDLANSPGAIVHKHSRGNMVRLGGVLYGLGGDVIPVEADKPILRPVLSLHTRVAFLKNVPAGETLGYSRTFKTSKDSVIATIPIGYYDGYSRSLSNCGRVIINGKFAPVVGRVSMDWTLIDVTDLPEAKVNDEVVVIGSQNHLTVTAEDLAGLTKTISYEITCGISNRVNKIFKR